MRWVFWRVGEGIREGTATVRLATGCGAISCPEGGTEGRTTANSSYCWLRVVKERQTTAVLLIEDLRFVSDWNRYKMRYNVGGQHVNK